MKTFFVQILLVSIFLLAGCGDAKDNLPLTNNKDTNRANIFKSDGSSNNQNETGESLKDNIKLSAIDEAQKNYQDSYNEYVRCLREVGPQKIETLKALSDYQKKYHIYQKLLKEESEK